MCTHNRTVFGSQNTCVFGRSLVHWVSLWWTKETGQSQRTNERKKKMKEIIKRNNAKRQAKEWKSFTHIQIRGNIIKMYNANKEEIFILPVVVFYFTFTAAWVCLWVCSRGYWPQWIIIIVTEIYSLFSLPLSLSHTDTHIAHTHPLISYTTLFIFIYFSFFLSIFSFFRWWRTVSERSNATVKRETKNWEHKIMLCGV